MNSKGITPLSDPEVCFVCQNRKSTNKYSIWGRGYGSSFDSVQMSFQCCDACNKPEFSTWFNEDPETSEYIENFYYEDKLYDMLHSLPLNSQEKIFNGCDGWGMESQDWIDFSLDELPHEKCKEYGMYSPEERSAYKDRFPTCDKVYREVWSDGSSGCRCEHGASGNADGLCRQNISDECYMCSGYNMRTEPIKIHYVNEELFEREKQRLKEMLEYAQRHLEELEFNERNMDETL